MPRAPALLPVAHSNIFLLVTDDAPSATLHSVGVFSFTPLTSLTLSRWIPPPLSLGLTICPTSQMGALLLVWMSHSLTVCLSLCVPHSVRRTLFLAFSASLTLSVCLSVFHRVPQTPLTLSLSDGCVGWGYSGPRNQTGALMVTFKNTTDEVRGGGSNCWAFRKYFPTGADAYRTGYHFQPPKNWMNDPNGAYTGCW